MRCLQDNEREETDGEDSQADSFVVADGYLSESERMDLEDIAAAAGGEHCQVSGSRAFVLGFLRPCAVGMQLQLLLEWKNHQVCVYFAAHCLF